MSSIALDPEFAPCEGGPQYRLERVFGVPRGIGFVRFGFALSAVMWVPLLVLSAWQGQVTGGADLPFLQSIGTHGRLLIAVPMYFLAEAQFNTRVRETITTMSRTLVGPDQRDELANAVDQAVRWRDSWIVEAIVMVLALAAVNMGTRAELPPGVSSWRETADGHSSAAGWWYLSISLTLSRYLLLRWLVRLLIWSRLLWRISRLDVPLMPAHPDLAAGLGGFGVAHLSLWPLAFGASVLVTSAFAEQVRFSGVPVESEIVPLVGFITGLTLVLIAPLFLFMPRLFDAKQRGMVEYGGLADSYVRAFDTKWLRGGAPAGEPLLGSADVQSLADLSSSFDIVRNMRVLPISWQQVIVLAGAAVLPALPLVFFVVSLDELIVRGLKTFVGV